MKINVGVSNRHVHLTEDIFRKLFGEDAVLDVAKELIQPGQYASSLTVTLKTEKSTIDKVRVLGPIRTYNQIEISKTDSYKLGLNPPVRNSGDLEGSAPITLVGPCGEVDLESGCIIAARHLHASIDDGIQYDLKTGDIVKVKIGGVKGGILDNVHVRSGEGHLWECHIDTDDANGNFINNGDEVEVIKE